jgi:uncharacterized protein with GYD domain
MQTYIMLANWTDQGIKGIADSPKRLDAAKALLASVGGRSVSFHMTMGAFDMVMIVEAPDDAAMARFVLALGKTGNVRSQTLKAFPEAAYRDLLGSLA